MTTPPVPLRRLASLVRSKNAGPFVLTVDVLFDRRDHYELVRRSGVISAESVAALYGVTVRDVHLVEHDAAMAIKVSLPRWASSGSASDTDVFGGQFHAPLVDLPIPVERI